MTDIWHTGWNSAADARIKNEQFGGEAMTDRLKEWLAHPPDDPADAANAALAALRAVVELHAPSVNLRDGLPYDYCPECGGVGWPCPTIRAVEKKVLK